jgi:hypothetical protein
MGEKTVSAPSDVAIPEEGVSFQSLFLLLLDPHGRAEPILNGLTQLICTPTSSKHVVSPLTYIGAQ